MKVWVVLFAGTDIEDNTVGNVLCGIFSTKEKAEAFLEEDKLNNELENECYYRGGYEYYIEEREVE